MHVHQTKISLPSIDHVSLKLLGPALVWNIDLQRPVERSQVLTVPAESVKVATLSFACTVMDMIDAEVDSVDSESVVTEFIGEVQTGQNLIDLLQLEKM